LRPSGLPLKQLLGEGRHLLLKLLQQRQQQQQQQQVP
jgi:hypothetical protein